MSIEWPTFTQGRIHEIKHRKKWELNQTLKYYQYVILNKNTLQVADRNKKHQVYNRMARCIGTRNTHQCRSHHQKIVKRFGSIDDFCKTFKAKHPLLFEPSAKFQCLEESFSDSKKHHSQKSQENVKSQSLSSRNLESSVQSGSERDADTEKGAEEPKPSNSEHFVNKSQKQCISKTAPSGTKHSQTIQAKQKTKKIRRKRRISYRPPQLNPILKVSLSNQQFIGSVTLNPQNFPSNHPYPYQNPFLSPWNDTPMGSFPSPSMNYRQELIKLTQTNLCRLPQRERLNMLEDGINYLMIRRSQMSQMMGQRNDMAGFGPFGEQRPVVSEDEMWMMAMAQKNLDMEGTGTSVKGGQMSERTWQGPKPQQEPFFPYDSKATELPFQLQHGYSFQQMRNSEPMMGYQDMDGGGN